MIKFQNVYRYYKLARNEIAIQYEYGILPCLMRHQFSDKIVTLPCVV